MPIKKWKTLSSEMILDNKWHKVQKDKVEVRPGYILDDYFLDISNDIVIIFAITKNNKVPLVRQYKHGAQEILLELPAGYMDDNEDPLASAKRELLEETGFESAKWKQLAFYYKNPTKSRGSNIYIFLAKEAKQTNKQNLDITEDIEIQITEFEKVKAMALSNEIKVGDSKLAILLAEKELTLHG